MKFSIIVPVYNAAEYLKKTVCSIMNQLVFDDEIILVDDGSSDDSLKICLELADNNSNIKVVHQSNGGPSKARNTGIRIASGDYLLFLDSDDAVKPQWLSSIRDYIRKYDVDVLCFGYTTIRSDHRGIIDMVPGFELYSNRNSITNLLPEIIDNFFFNVVWNKAYKRSLVIENNIEFDETLYIGEDRKFCLDVIAVCNSWCMLPESLYYYIIQNSESISSKCDLNRLHQMLIVNQKYSDVLKLSRLSDVDQEVRVNYERIKIFTSHLIDYYRSESKNKISYFKKIHKSNYIGLNASYLKRLSHFQRITYFVWTIKFTGPLYLYVCFLNLYKYKFKLYKESNAKL